MKAKMTINGIEFSGKNLVGEKFGRLTVVALHDVIRRPGNRGRSARWQCVCGCPERTLRVVPREHLTTGHTQSCGCLRKETVAQASRTHGHTSKEYGDNNSPIYRIFQCMHSRCRDRTGRMWKFYGSRGISVCERWSKFENFLADMGSTWVAGLSLDRINSEGGYEPTNCRWATKLEQANNTRSNRFAVYNGKRQTMSQWSREVGISSALIAIRIDSGWTIEEALTTPARKCVRIAEPSQLKDV